MDCREINEHEGYVISYLLQDDFVNPEYFPLFFEKYVVLPDGTKAEPGQKRYEIRDDAGFLIWCYENDKRRIPTITEVDELLEPKRQAHNAKIKAKNKSI